jgi:hypothetical protein
MSTAHDRRQWAGFDPTDGEEWLSGYYRPRVRRDSGPTG